MALIYDEELKKIKNKLEVSENVCLELEQKSSKNIEIEG